MQTQISNWIRGAAALSVCAFLMACGPLRYTPHGTVKAPEADAVIEAEVQKGSGLTRFDVTIKHLAPPERLSSGGTTFVVWARQGDAAPWQRIGALNYDEDDRRGEMLEASVPLTSFSLIVSIEKQPAPEKPSSDVVLTQDVNK